MPFTVFGVGVGVGVGWPVLCTVISTAILEQHWHIQQASSSIAATWPAAQITACRNSSMMSPVSSFAQLTGDPAQITACRNLSTMPPVSSFAELTGDYKVAMELLEDHEMHLYPGIGLVNKYLVNTVFDVPFITDHHQAASISSR